MWDQIRGSLHDKITHWKKLQSSRIEPHLSGKGSDKPYSTALPLDYQVIQGHVKDPASSDSDPLDIQHFGKKAFGATDFHPAYRPERSKPVQKKCDLYRDYRGSCANEVYVLPDRPIPNWWACAGIAIFCSVFVKSACTGTPFLFFPSGIDILWPSNRI
jgi:hypothetical protein